MKTLKNKLQAILANLILITFTGVFLYFVYFYITEFNILINQ